MITFTGVHVTREFGAPTVVDQSVQSMRLCRFGGAGQSVPFWPVGMHQLFAADIAKLANEPILVQLHLLIHDSTAEVCTGDPPVPMKVDEMRILMDRIEHRSLALIGIEPPSADLKKIIKYYDWKAVHAEGWAGCGPRGYCDTQHNYEEPCFLVKRLILDYIEAMSQFGYDNLFQPDGHWPLELESRIRQAHREVRNEH